MISVKSLVDCVKSGVQLSGNEKETVKKEALDLCLKYGFVTPLTSMVVTKPQGEDSQVAHKPKEGERSTGSRLIVPQGGSFSMIPKRRGFSQVSMPSYDRFTGSIGKPAGYPLIPAGYPRISAAYPGMQAHPGTVFRAEQGMPGPPQVKYYLTADSFSAQGAGAADQHMEDYDYNATTQPTEMPTTTASPLTRFLLPAEGQAIPLCYDIPVALSLRLLKDPNNELSMNGQLGQSNSEGYQKIVIHYRSDQHIEFDTTGITVNNGQNATYFPWSLNINNEKDSVSLILRNKEMDITMGSTRVIIMLYKRNGNVFLWPVLRQRPTGDNITGIMARPPVVYEEVRGTVIKLKIQDKEVASFMDSAVDLNVHSAPTVNCWLIPLQSALQGELADLTITQL